MGRLVSDVCSSRSLARQLVGGKRDGVRLEGPGSVVCVTLIPKDGGWLMLGLARKEGDGRLEAMLAVSKP